MIIFLYGEDTFRSRQKLKELKDKFIKEVDPSGNNIFNIDGGKAAIGAIKEVIGARSLFVRKRMIIIENIFSNKSEKVQEGICEYLKSQLKLEKKSEQGDNVIIFWEEISGDKQKSNKLFKFLSEQKITQNFKKLSNTETVNWIKNETQLRGAKIDASTASALAGMFNGDLWQLNNEINKLINYKQAQLLPESEVIIVMDDVEALSSGNVNENIFALTDAISNKNKALTMSLFEKELAAGVADTYLLTMVIRQFKILLQVKEASDLGMSPHKMTSQLHLHPFVVQKCSSQVRGFSLLALKEIFSSLIEIDKKMKTGQVDFKVALSLLFAKI